MMFSPLLVPQAYLDPGSGSILIQLILAVLLGFGVIVRAQWSRIRKLFGNKKTPISMMLILENE